MRVVGIHQVMLEHREHYRYGLTLSPIRGFRAMAATTSISVMCGIKMSLSAWGWVRLPTPETLCFIGILLDECTAIGRHEPRPKAAAQRTIRRRLPALVRPALPQESVYSFRVCRRAISTSVIGKVPITRSIATSATVARLSVMTTESVSSPVRCPIGVDTSTTTRLGWFARNRRLVIIATMTWDNPVCKLSAWIISAGRVFAVRKSEFG
jgi:hypothetical protein